MRKTIKNRILCYVLAALLVITLIPSATVLAVENKDSGWNMTKVSTNVVNENGAKIGSLSSYEGVTVLDYYPSKTGMVKVEYSGTSSAKIGYIPSSSLLYRHEGGGIATINSSCTTYCTPSTTFYAGSVSTGEFVAIIAIENGWAYVEYNVSNGLRKRAYLPESNITPLSNSYLITSRFYHSGRGLSVSVSTTSNTTVYSGPSEHYSVIGTIYPSDNGSITSYSTFYTNGTWHYVSYPAGGTVKYGYIKK